jgi:cysteinyl-tRNA synthetase
MSKSLGNFVTIADVLKEWPGEVVRFNMLRTHYRQPIDWTRRALRESQGILRDLTVQYQFAGNDARPKTSDELARDTLRALLEDLNTPLAIARMQREAHRADSSTWRLFAGVLGIDFGRFSAAPDLPGLLDAAKRDAVEFLVSTRLEARKSRDWKKSDEIRDELLSMGIQIMDNKDGTTSWEVKR